MDIISSLDPACFRPPSSSVGINHSDEYIRSGSGKDSIRRIFNNVQFDEFELQSIEECEVFLYEQEVKLPQGWTQSETLKYLYAAKFDSGLAAKMIKNYLDWQADPQSLALTQGTQICLESGAVYMWGFDNQCRPILIVDLNKVNATGATAEDLKGALAISMEILRTYFFVPGKVENWIIIVDAQNIETLETAKLDSVTQLLNCCFPSTLEMLFIISSPESVEKHSEFIKAGLDRDMAEQVEVVTSNDLFRLQTYIPPTSLERKYGGTASNLEAFWPPQGRAVSRRGSELNLSKKSLTALEAQEIAEAIHTDQVPAGRHTTAGLINHYNVDNSVDFKDRFSHSTLAERLLASGGYGSRKINRGEFQKYTPEKAASGMENEEQFIRSFLFTKSPTKSAMNQSHLRQDQLKNAQFTGNALEDDLRSEQSRANDALLTTGSARNGAKRRNTRELQVNTELEMAKKGDISTGDKTPKEWIKDQLNTSAAKVDQNEDRGGFCGFCIKRSNKPAQINA